MPTDRLYRAFAGLLGWAGLVLQFALLVGGHENPRLGALNYFSYFTILTNIIAASAMTAAGLAPESAAGRFFLRPGVRTAITLYIAVVFVIYHAILAAQWDPQGWALAADVILHTATPVLFLLDWLVLTPKRELRFAALPVWLIYPALYGLYALARGAVDRFYPYPFLDAGEIGYGRALLNIAALVGGFLGGGAALVAAGRALPESPAAHRRPGGRA